MPIRLKHLSGSQVTKPHRRIAKGGGQQDVGRDPGREQPSQNLIVLRRIGIDAAKSAFDSVKRMLAAPQDPRFLGEAGGHFGLQLAKPTCRVGDDRIRPEASGQMVIR
ncbi:hypothetical protein D3C74_385770 [compost metagenome]